MSAYGVDFGTSNSVVARFHSGVVEVLDIDEPPVHWQGLGFERVMPSVVAIGRGRKPLFGWSARGATKNIEAVKRLLRDVEVSEVGGETFEVEELTAMLFRRLADAAAGTGAEPLTSAVVTIPANSRGVARHRTKVCAGMGGIHVLALINEPTAAAMSASLRSPHDETLMVVDWGGGTLDVTILRNLGGVFIEEASAGVGRLGGLDFDGALARLIEGDDPSARAWRPSALPRYRLDLERAKVQLSTHDTVEVPLPTGEVRQVARAEFEAAAQPLVESVREPIARCLADLRGEPIHRLALVGGTCNVPLVRRLVTELVGVEPIPDIDPMTAVAEGAAIAAAILSGELEGNDFFVSTEHALGTVVTDPMTMREEFAVIIPRNHKLPAKRTETYTPMIDFQQSVDVQVIEGDPDQPIDDSDNVMYTEMSIDLPGRIASRAAVEMTLEYDVDGVLHVGCVDVTTSDELHRTTVSFGAAADPRRLVGIATRVQRTFDDDRVEARGGLPAALDPEAARVIELARAKVLPYIDEDDGGDLEELIDEVIAGDDHAPLARLLERRWPYLLG